MMTTMMIITTDDDDYTVKYDDNDSNNNNNNIRISELQRNKIMRSNLCIRRRYKRRVKPSETPPIPSQKNYGSTDVSTSCRFKVVKPERKVRVKVG